MGDEKRCAVCGAQVRRDGHHLTGRGPDGRYLDPSLVAELCHDDHELVHDDLRRQHIDQPLQSENVLERIERCLRRVGAFLGRVSDVTGIAWFAALATAGIQWATDLRGVIAALDQWNLGWRGAIG